MKTIDDFASKTGFVGPHTFYAMPGRMLVQALSNAKDHGGVTGMVAVQQQGQASSTSTPCRSATSAARRATATATTSRINPAKNAMLTSSFTGWNNYMMDLGKLIKDAEAMKNFGNTMVVWDLKAMKPQQGVRRAGRAAGDPLVAEERATTGPSPPPR